MSWAIKKFAYILLTGLGLYIVVFGLIYATRTELMPHHGAALPEDVKVQVMPLYHALMRLAGGAIVSFGLLCLFVVHRLWRNGSKGALVVASVLLFGFFAWTAITAARLELAVGVSTHWQIMGVLATISLLALVGAVWKSR